MKFYKAFIICVIIELVFSFAVGYMIRTDIFALLNKIL